MPAKRIAVLTSHPIEQQGPFFKVLAAAPDVDLHVFFSWEFGVKGPTLDPELGIPVQWDIPLREGYSHSFLKNIWPWPSSSHFWGETNPGVIPAIWRGRYDALIIYGWSFCTSWLAYFTAFLRGTPVYIRGENPLNQEMLKAPGLRDLKRLILGWLFRRTAGFFCIGEENRKFYEYYGVPASKLHFVPYAVDNARFMAEADRLAPQKAALRKEFGIGAEDVVILSLGKLIEKKRPMDLLMAYERISAPQKALVFVGEGAIRPQLEEYVRSHNIPSVHFMGFRNQTEIGKFYALADIFAFPSGPGDTWGFVLNEAMCFGLPLVASDIVGSVPDLVHSEKNGYVFPVGDVEALARALMELVRDPERRRAFGKTSREIVRGYSYERGLEGMVRVVGK